MFFFFGESERSSVLYTVLKQATFHAKESLEYGTKIIGGVSSPKKAGTSHLGLPVFGSVREVRFLI